jgi:hypothetical protein
MKVERITPLSSIMNVDGIGRIQLDVHSKE